MLFINPEEPGIFPDPEDGSWNENWPKEFELDTSGLDQCDQEDVSLLCRLIICHKMSGV